MSQTQVERLFIADKTTQFAKIFRLHTTFTTAGAYITANWEADDTPGVGQLGANIVTESSGVFSFTKTGLYKPSERKLYTRKIPKESNRKTSKATKSPYGHRCKWYELS